MAEWYKRNPDQGDIDSAKKESQSKSARRFYLKEKESKHVVFLDDEVFSVWEHNPVINGSEFWHFFTCRKGVDPSDPVCPMCAAGIARTYTGYLTILDNTGWKNKKGDIIKNNRQLFPMTLKSLERYNVIKAKKTSLVGARFELTRTSKDALKLGDMWDFETYVKPFEDEQFWFDSKIQNKKLPPEPFDYMEVLKPLSSEEMRMVLDGVVLRGKKGEDDTGTEGGGDEDELY